MKFRLGFLIVLTVLFTTEILAQSNNNFSWNGDARYAYTSAGGDAFEHFDGTSYLRLRVGALYTINEQSSIKARLATTQSDELDPVRFTIIADGGGLNRGSISFDEFYYQYRGEDVEFKVGRFQYSPRVLSNAKRSLFRFQSNHINVHWTDGLYAKKYLNQDWYGELVAEYQNRGNTSYSYRGDLNFGENEHNVATYFQVENRTRDDNNIIQKAFGFFYAPSAYAKPDGYSYYAAFLSQIVYDLPARDVLNGGSFRVAGELGQNLNADFADGNSMNISFGVNNFADKHELMVEFTKIGSEWLTPNVYSPNADEMEIRYRFFINSKMFVDFRYRIRENRSESVDTNYNFFGRFNYKF